jgi:hypothetical protein
MSKKNEGEVAGSLAEREADAINAAAPVLDLEAIGAVLLNADELAAKKRFNHGAFVAACAEIERLTVDDAQSQSEFVDRLAALLRG